MEKLKYKEEVEHGTALFPMRCYEFEGVDQQCMVNLHWHNEIEWIYITKGTLQIQIENSVMNAQANDIISIPSQGIHQIRSIGDTHYYAIVFSLEFLNFQNFDVVQREYISPIVQHEAIIDIHLHNHEKANPFIIHIMRSILRAYYKKEETWEFEIKIQLYQIILALYKQKKIAVHKHHVHDEKVHVIKSVISYIEKHYQEKIYIRDIAIDVHLNEQYLCRLFKSMTSKTLIEFMNEFRIEKACECLQLTNQSIMEIAFFVGFENVSYFISKFKKVKKKTPQQYRVQIRTYESTFSDNKIQLTKDV